MSSSSQRHRRWVAWAEIRQAFASPIGVLTAFHDTASAGIPNERRLIAQKCPDDEGTGVARPHETESSSVLTMIHGSSTSSRRTNTSSTLS